MSTESTQSSDAANEPTIRSAERTGELSAVRTSKPDREQMVMLAGALDDALPPDHPARMVWAAVGKLDLSRFHETIKAREGVAGREAIDPSVLVSLWLLAAINGVASGRQLDQLCRDHVAYRWMCGGVSVNYHTLNHFRTGHREAIDDLLTQVLGHLTHAGLVSVECITQDGTRARACAGTRSFKKRTSLERHLAEARARVQELGCLADESPAQATERQRSNQQRAAEQRLLKVQQAMEQLAKVQRSKDQQKNKPSKTHEAKASTTDPEARIQKMPEGGFRPAHNVQFAQDPVSRAIVGVAVAPDGNDKQQAEPMREQVERRTGRKVRRHLVDGGFLTLEGIDAAAEQGVTVLAPVPASRKQGQDRHAARPGDSAAVKRWRQLMSTPEAQKEYRLRAATCETVNADLKTHRGLGRLLVRGTAKVLCVATWSAIAYNLLHFGAAMIT